MWMDRQTDIGHINLIGRLVTRNPPKKKYLNQANEYEQSIILPKGHWPCILTFVICLMSAWNLLLKTKFRDSFLSLNSVYRGNVHQEVISNI